MLGVNLFTLGLWLFQEGVGWIRSCHHVARDGLAGPVGGPRAVHHVMLVDRGHD